MLRSSDAPGRNTYSQLFSGSVADVNASANLYSLIETCKATGLEPYVDLRRLFTELPKAQTVEGFEALLPHALAADPTLAHLKLRR